MNFLFSGLRATAISCGCAMICLGFLLGPGATAASAQAVYWWAPSPGYGYLPPLPVYRPARQYLPAPVYPSEYPGYQYAPASRARALNPAQIRGILGEQGLRLSGAPTRNRDVYVADVRDSRGNQRRLIIDGYNGQLLQSFPGPAARQALPLREQRLRIESDPARSRYAGRPVDPEIDPDIMPPDGPAVIPGVGPGFGSRGILERGSPQGADPLRPRVTNQKKNKPAKRLAAKPPVVKTVPAALPLPPAPASAIAPQVQQPAPAALPAPAAPPPAEAISSTPPAGAAASAVTGQPPVAAAPVQQGAQKAAAEPEQPADRPRRRVRFLKPDSPAITDAAQPGGIVTPALQPPVIAIPRTASASPKPPTPGVAPPAGQALPPVAVAPLE